MAVNGFEVREFGTRQGQKMVLHRLVVFADDEQAALWQQVMHICHAAGDGVVHRNHGAIRPLVAHGSEGFLETQAGQCGIVRKNRAAGQVGV